MGERDYRIKIDEDAAARVKELGFQREFEQMLEHAQRTAPGFRRIHVTLQHDPECPQNDPGIILWVNRDDLPDPTKRDPTDWDWCGWMAHTFPPEVGIHFSLISTYGDAHVW
jgi:hypothetical protein